MKWHHQCEAGMKHPSWTTPMKPAYGSSSTPVVFERKNKTNGLYYHVLIVITAQSLTQLSNVQPGIIKKLFTCNINMIIKLHCIMHATLTIKCDMTGLYDGLYGDYMHILTKK